jgi:hypothetical protein
MLAIRAGGGRFAGLAGSPYRSGGGGVAGRMSSPNVVHVLNVLGIG